jgi:plasmid stabilization system protein ParE
MLSDEFDPASHVHDPRPGTFPASYRGTRRALVNRFPYSIYFVVQDQSIAVVAVLDGNREQEEQLAKRR